MYCSRCGNQIADDALFCSKCGAKVQGTNNRVEEKKENTKETVSNVVTDMERKTKTIVGGMGKKTKIIVIGLLGVLILLFLVMLIKGLNSDAKAYKAYKEYYEEFYEENKDSRYEFDCGGQIVINEDGKPLLVLCDIVEEADGEYLSDVYVYEYKRGDVEQLAKKKGLISDRNGIYVDECDNTITLLVVNEETTVYVLEDDMFREDISMRYIDGEVLSNNIYSRFWGTTVKLYEKMNGLLQVALFSNHTNAEINAIQDKDFEDLLDKLAKETPKTKLELKQVYNEFFIKERIYEKESETGSGTVNTNIDGEKVVIESEIIHTGYVYEKENYMYFGVTTKPGTLYYVNYIGGGVAYLEDDENMSVLEIYHQYEMKRIPKNIEGKEVELSSNVVKSLIEELDIEDFEDIKEGKDKGVFETEEGYELELNAELPYLWTIDEEEYKATGEESSYKEIMEYIENGDLIDIKVEYYSTDNLIESPVRYIRALIEEDRQRGRVSKDADIKEKREKEEAESKEEKDEAKSKGLAVGDINAVNIIEGDEVFVDAGISTKRFEMIDNILYITTSTLLGETVVFEVAEDCEWYTSIEVGGEKVETLTYEQVKEIIEKGSESYKDSETYVVNCVDGLVTDVYILLGEKRYFNESSFTSTEEPKYDNSGTIVG